MKPKNQAQWSVFWAKVALLFALISIGFAVLGWALRGAA